MARLLFDPIRARLRDSVAKIDREISRLPSSNSDDDPHRPDALLAAWDDLVGQLALGPEPAVRECPTCSHVCMRLATRCGFCWSTLPPPPEPDDLVS